MNPRIPRLCPRPVVLSPTRLNDGFAIELPRRVLSRTTLSCYGNSWGSSSRRGWPFPRGQRQPRQYIFAAHARLMNLYASCWTWSSQTNLSSRLSYSLRIRRWPMCKSFRYGKDLLRSVSEVLNVRCRVSSQCLVCGNGRPIMVCMVWSDFSVRRGSANMRQSGRVSQAHGLCCICWKHSVGVLISILVFLLFCESEQSKRSEMLDSKLCRFSRSVGRSSKDRKSVV